MMWLHIIGCFLWVFLKDNAYVEGSTTKMAKKYVPQWGYEIDTRWYTPQDWANFPDIMLYNKEIFT